MPLKFSTLVIFLFGFIFQLHAHLIKGKIVDEKNNPIPGVWIGIENSEYRALSNKEGLFELKVPSGNYIVHFRCIGYADHQEKIKIDSKEINITIVLKENVGELSSLMISADRSDFAKYLMDKAKERYLLNANPDSILVLQGYQKSTVQGFPIQPKGNDEALDSTKIEAEIEMKIDLDTSKWEKWWRKKFPRLYHRKDSINDAKLHSAAYKFLKDSIPTFSQRHLMENLAEHQFPIGKEHHEHVSGEVNYSPYRPYRPGGAVSIGANIQYGEDVIYNERDVSSNTQVLESHTALEEFDILQHHLRVDGVSQKLIASPFSDLGHATYLYSITNFEERIGGNVYCIQIQPRFKREALIQGSIWIQDSTFRIEKIEYTFTPRALTYYNDFTFRQELADWKNIQYVKSRIIDYHITQDLDSVHGKTIMVFDTPHFVSKNQLKKSKELQSYADDYDQKDQAYWKAIRPIPLDSMENEYAHFCDSVQTKYNSTRYLTIRDSLYNKITFWDVTLSGINFQNSFKKIKYSIAPLMANYDFLGVGGVRPKINGSFSKEFESGKSIFIEPNLSYGFANQDLRGSLSVGVGYNPNKFMRTNISVEDNYNQLNRTPSISTVLARSNYIRSKGFGINHTMQIVPALFGRFAINYSEKTPLNGMKLEDWSDALYGQYNRPVDFQSYSRLDLNLRFEYRIGQKYYSKKGRIYYLPNKNPRIFLEYFQGVPGFFKSTIDYKRIMFRMEQNFSIPVIGEGFWNFETGQYLSKKNISVGEYFYFRGTDPYWFSNPSTSFQLLGLQLSSSSSYMRGSYLHHFNGMFTNKIPLINRLKITETAGTAFLGIPDQGFWHQELYVGAERIFKIKGQMFRFSAYACTSDNNFTKAAVTYKFGIAFFNTFTKRWNF